MICVHAALCTLMVILEIYHSCRKVSAFGHQWSNMEASLKLTRLISALGSWGFSGTLNYTSVMRKTNSLSDFSVEVFHFVQNRRDFGYHFEERAPTFVGIHKDWEQAVIIHIK